MPLAVRAFVPGESEVAEILFPQRLVEMELRLELPLDLRRRRRAFAIERTSRRRVHEQKRDGADDQQQRNGEGDAF